MDRYRFADAGKQIGQWNCRCWACFFSHFGRLQATPEAAASCACNPMGAGIFKPPRSYRAIRLRGAPG